MLREISGVMLVMLFVLGAARITAQDEALPRTDIIQYGDQVSETLTEDAFWDWWIIQAEENDELVIDMLAHDPLEPLLGLLDPSGQLLTRSENGTAGGHVTLTYTVPATGEYTIVATRTGNENGTSTGQYDLTVRRDNAPDLRESAYQQVSFRCRDFEVTNAATLQFGGQNDQVAFYVISVYGLDGFQPVIRVHLSAVDLEDCSRDSQGMTGNRYALPDMEPITITGQPENAAQLVLSGAGETGLITLTIGSTDGSAGRYVAVIDGFNLHRDTPDILRIGQGPLAATAPLTVYMVSNADDRLDPTIRAAEDQDTTTIILCDDAGRRGCDDIASPDGLAFEITATLSNYTADRFDAAALLQPGPPSLRTLELGSFTSTASGRYALVLLGELPARQSEATPDS